MPIETPSNQPAEWLSFPVIATTARLLCREWTLQNEYLRSENNILKSRLPGRIRFTDDERRSLVDASLAMGRKLVETVVNIVKPTYNPCLAAKTRKGKVGLLPKKEEKAWQAQNTWECRGADL